MNEIPFFTLTRQYRQYQAEFDRAYRTVVEHGFFTLGPTVAAFEERFAAFVGARWGVGVGSGTDAIILALKALGVRLGDEVIVPANAYPTAFAVSQTGAKIRLVDCGEDGNLDPAKLKPALSVKTKAVVAVHLYGNPADLESIQEVIDEAKQKIYLLEDAAQAHGAELKIRNSKLETRNSQAKKATQKWTWKKVGGIGDIGCFSFYPTKNVGAYGDGGLVVTNDERVMKHLRRLRMYGEEERYRSLEIAGVTRLDELQTAFLLVKLAHLQEWNARRRAIASVYARELAGVGDIRFVSRDTPASQSCYHLFVVRSQKRDALKKHLAQVGIGTGIHYPVPIHAIKAFRFLGYRAGDFPLSEALSRQVLSLPMFPELTDGEVEWVTREIKIFFKKH